MIVYYTWQGFCPFATLAGRVADPLQPYPCEVANYVAVFRELSWLARRMAEVQLDRKAAGLRLAHLHSHRLGLA